MAFKSRYICICLLFKIETKLSDLCVQCDGIRLHPDDKMENIFVSDRNTCCVKSEHAPSLVAYVRILNISSVQKKQTNKKQIRCI